jgi:hypothetical protein
MVGLSHKLVRRQAGWAPSRRWWQFAADFFAQGGESGLQLIHFCLGGYLNSEKEFGHGHECSDLSNPEKEHPFDDFSFDVRSVLLGHQALGQILLLLTEGQFQAFGDGTSFGRLYLGRFQD